MGSLSYISRRRMLSISAVAVGLVVIHDRRASSQPTKRIEQYASELESIISTSEPIQELASALAGHSDPPKDFSGGRKAVIFSIATFITTDA